MAKEFSIINGLYSGNLAEDVASHFGKKPLTVDRRHYGNGCRFGQVIESMRGQNVYIFQTQNKPEADVCAMEGARLISIAHQSSAAMVVFIMASAIYAQSDGEDQPHVPVTLRTTAQLLESQCPNIPFKVVWVDGHSKALTSVFRAGVTDGLSARYMFASYIKEHIGLNDLGLVATDLNLPRAKKLRKAAGIPELYYFDKEHLNNSKTETGSINRPLANKRLILFDDIIVSGNSVKGPIRALVEAGAEEIYPIVTHTHHNQDFLDFIENIPQVKKFIYTDSVPITPELKSSKTHPLTLKGLFSNYIECIQAVKSISPLYKENNE